MRRKSSIASSDCLKERRPSDCPNLIREGELKNTQRGPPVNACEKEEFQPSIKVNGRRRSRSFFVKPL